MREAKERRWKWATGEEMRENFLICWPVYFKHYAPVIAVCLLENSTVAVSGGAREGELEAYDVTARLGEIQTPTLVMAGRDDWLCPPSQAHILHEGIPNSELVIFEDSGHLPYVEEPELFFSSVRNWVKRANRNMQFDQET